MIERKIEPFSIQTIIDFHENQDDEKWALKALVTLLTRSDLEVFTESIEKDNYLMGLEKLFNLCLEKQEKQVEELKSKALNSPEKYIENAKSIYTLICQGCFERPAVNNKVIEAVAALDIVLELFGSEEYPEAHKLKSLILSKINKEETVKSSDYLRNGTDG